MIDRYTTGVLIRHSRNGKKANYHWIFVAIRIPSEQSLSFRIPMFFIPYAGASRYQIRKIGKK